jgi:hypothetical protein
VLSRCKNSTQCICLIPSLPYSIIAAASNAIIFSLSRSALASSDRRLLLLLLLLLLPTQSLRSSIRPQVLLMLILGDLLFKRMLSWRKVITEF